MAHIFVIEDDAPIQRLLQLFLNDAGHKVTITGQSPLEMIPTLAETSPDLILLDLMFGNEPLGWKAAQKLKTTPQTQAIPIILCSAANRNIETLQASAPIKEIEILFKPFDLDALGSMVDRVLMKASTPAFQ